MLSAFSQRRYIFSLLYSNADSAFRRIVGGGFDFKHGGFLNSGFCFVGLMDATTHLVT